MTNVEPSFDQQWLFRDMAGKVRVQISSVMPELVSDLDSEVDELWRTAQDRMGGTMFNGQVFCVDNIGSDHLTGHWTEYRRLAAQLEKPELFEVLRIRSLAVNGILLCPDGVVFGRRPDRAIYQAGLWQLAPAGSVDPESVGVDGQIDVIRQTAIELREELGVGFECIASATPVGLVEHPISRVCDLGIVLHTPSSATHLLAAHARDGDGEYGLVRVVSRGDIAQFAWEVGDGMARQSRLFLNRLGWLTDEG